MNVLFAGEEQNITLSYSKAEDYPVDLYYIMDLSYTMERYKDKLSELGGEIAEAMRKLTSNFRLGFGSFVDKVELPMTNTVPTKYIINLLSLSFKRRFTNSLTYTLLLQTEVTVSKMRACLRFQESHAAVRGYRPFQSNYFMCRVRSH